MTQLPRRYLTILAYFAFLACPLVALLAQSRLLDLGAAKPPVAKKVDKTFTIHGETRSDPYYWLREKTNPEVIAYLEAENAYTKAVMKPTEPLQEVLYKEMVSHMIETDLTVPHQLGGYWYYTRTVKGLQYPIYCRKKKSLDAPEQIMVDLNELAKGKKFAKIAQFEVSDDGNLLAYSVDFSGFRDYTLFVKDLRTGELLPDRVLKVDEVEWASDNKTFFCVTEDAAKRAYRLYRHTLGQPQGTLVYEEKDEQYELNLTRSRDRAYLFATSASSTTTEVRALPSSDASGQWKTILPRVEGQENYAEHRDGQFYIRTNKDARNFRLVTAPVNEPTKWKELVAHRPKVMLEEIDLFANYCVLTERDQGQERLQVIDLRSGQKQEIEFSEKVYAVGPSTNLEFQTETFRLEMQSLTTPETIYDYDMNTRKLTLLKQKQVPGGFDRVNYVSERIFATASDGTRIPVSLVYKKGTPRDGSSPLLLYGYGAYGISTRTLFSSPRLSLLDRGVIYAIAHVRGGGEMGKIWSDQGKMMSKRNTFTDFIAVADYLVDQKYTSRNRLAIQGGSAGGLTMAAVLNFRPDLCKAAVLQVPFVDVINTMLDASLPLTVPEYQEWGNPNVKKDYDYMKSYCPYTNIAAKPYPAMLVRTSFNDSQVMYWEPAKYVAKLRATKTDNNPLLFTCNMSAGHGGDSGRYDALREQALTYAFLLGQLEVRGLGKLTLAGDAPVDVPAADAGFYLHRFEYDPPEGKLPKSVFVGGEFNNWSQTTNPMTADGSGHFVADVKLAEGAHSYRFFVDGGWVNDSAKHSEADLEESNGTRGRNSAIFVGPDGRGLPQPEPGKIAVQGMHHVPTNIRYFDPVSPSEVRIAFGAQSGNLTGAAVYSLVGVDWRRDVLYPVETRAGISYFAGVVLTQKPSLTYFFELKSGGTTGYYAGGKYFSTLADAERNAWQGALQPAFDTPSWARQAIWYQIFPERFRNGEASNDPPNTLPWTARWSSPLPGGAKGNVNSRRYGGDIQGIKAQLPYLRGLGVTCIYLNPIFKSPSLHKYDTTDYRHVDDNFGFKGDIAELKGETEDPATWQWTKSDKLFLDFVADAHRQGFKVILDGVFNHSGKQFFAFADLQKNGRDSKYANWFDVSGWQPLTWTSFGGSRNGGMPELKQDPATGLTPGPRDFFFNITRRWLAPDGDPARGVDGFRLDYAQHIPRVFWVDYRKLVKSIKPEAFIDGEIWTPASTYLTGDTWDATMQYAFLNAVQGFFVNGERTAIPASVFAERLQRLTFMYPFQVSLNQMNLLGSHDTERWASRFVNADQPLAPGGGKGGKAKFNSSRPTDLQWQRMKQTVAVQMTYVGAPMVYYGDEAGMWGGNDPDDRQPMVWRDLQPYADPDVKFKQDLFDHYARLIAVHRRLSALHAGFAHTMLADDARKLLVYSRDLGDEHVFVLINRSDKGQSVDLMIGASGKDVGMIDWADPTQTALQPASADVPDGRPKISPIAGAAPAVVVHHGTATVSLKPWGAMILAPADAK